MQVKSKNGLKVVIIAVALLLCLALAIGITGAFYQAKRQATGTLSMDQGIIIDYKGFGKTPDEGIWSRENKTTFLLFNETNAQPGQNIPVNTAGIRANEKSVNFYARVKLSYKFYNGETPVEFAESTKLIKTSSDFFGTNWVESGDGYFYYATGSTLNKFTKTATTFVDLFATDAKFIIEGAGFTGADNNGEGGGFVDGTTSINKIEVYLTLETLQGDADAAAEGWKIASQVDFAKVDEGKIVKSNTTEVVTDEQLNVTINGNQTTLETVKFPYGEETVLEFDSKNVEYVELTYSDNTTERFYELEASENSSTKYSQIQVLADENKKVTGYIVGLFGGLTEYNGFVFSTKNWNWDSNDEQALYYDVVGGVAVTGYYGTLPETGILEIPSKPTVRSRSVKIVITGYGNDAEKWAEEFEKVVGGVAYPCKVEGYNDEITSLDMFYSWGEENYYNKKDQIPTSMTITFETMVQATGILSSGKTVVEIGSQAFMNSEITGIDIPNTITKIGYGAFEGSGLTSINIPSSVTTLGGRVFAETQITNITISDNVTSNLQNSDFEGCTKLTSVIIGSGITSISNATFRKCSNQIELTINSSVPPTLVLDNETQFEKVTKIYVPAGSLSAYQSDTNWAKFASLLEEKA